MHAPAIVPGYFGKLMSYADFVTRRMPPGFLARWDTWLQEAVHAARRRMGDDWLSTYLHSPVWRFALAPGACDSHAWAGILMPSVDSIGRQFPLTIVTRLPQGADIFSCLRDGHDWYATMETLALSSLDEQFDLDEFDAALSASPATFSVGGASDQLAPDGWRLAIPGIDQLERSLPAIAATLAGLSLVGHSLWWTDGAEKIAPSLLACKGLPAPASMAGMLDGRWEQSGWRSCEAVSHRS